MTTEAEALLQKTKELIAIPSTADNREALNKALEYVADFVRQRNPSVTIEYFETNGVRSFLAFRGKERPAGFHVMLNGHVDVVPGKPGQFKAKVKDGKLYGRGAYDMKAACITMAEVFCEFVNDVPYELGLQIVTDEEIGGYDGAYYQIQQGVRSDFVICGECGRHPDNHEIANETKGGAYVDVEFYGKTSHAGYPWRGDNATIKAAQFAQKIYDLYPTPNEEYHETTVTVTAILSETGVHNRIPEHALVRLDIRRTSNDRQFDTRELVTEFVQRIDPSAQVTIPHFAKPMLANPDGEFMQDLKRAAEAVEGQNFRFVRRHGSGDGRHYAEIGGQACEFGIAGIDQHGDDEHITLQAFEHYYNTMRQFLRNTRVAGQAPPEEDKTSVK